MSDDSDGHDAMWQDAEESLHELQLDVEDALFDQMDTDYHPGPEDDDDDDDDDDDYVVDDDDDDDDDTDLGHYIEFMDADEHLNDDQDEDEDDDEDDDDDDGDRIYGRGLGATAASQATLLRLAALMEATGGAGAGSAGMTFLEHLLGPSRTTRRPAAPRAADLRARARWWTPQTEPHPAGLALLNSGEFGPVGPWSPAGSRSAGRRRPSERFAVRQRYANLGRLGGGRFTTSRYHLTGHVHDPPIPNTPGTVVASYPDVPYVGQYCGEDDSMFYSATRGFMLYLYDMTRPRGLSRNAGGRNGFGSAAGEPPSDAEYMNGVDSDSDDFGDGWLGGWRPARHQRVTEDSSLHTIKSEQGEIGQWTITDADADRAGRRMIYSSITPFVYMMNTADDGQRHVELDFTADRYEGFGIWSIRFSADGKEVVAGASNGRIMVYDLNAHRRSLMVGGHRDDVNAVCFADEASTNVLVSGSDDGYVKIWDRRSLASNTPAGVLVGATEGITYTGPKGDGRYIVVNSKDQAARLYDLRKMLSWSQVAHEADAVERWGHPHFDYRGQRYPPPKRLAHPQDCSVMTYRGHTVLRTLIRCHFSPLESTGQSYIYSGSADGLIHIWSLDGRIVQVLNRVDSRPLRSGGDANGGTGPYTDPSAEETPPRRRRIPNGPHEQGTSFAVRDVAWHSRTPTLMSTCWEHAGRYRDGTGSVAMHEWKGLGKGGLRSLEDWVAKQAEEEASRPTRW